jgi:hypothetical protein
MTIQKICNNCKNYKIDSICEICFFDGERVVLSFLNAGKTDNDAIKFSGKIKTRDYRHLTIHEIY